MSSARPPSSAVGVLGVPFALGGWIPEMSDAIVDMTRTPVELRSRGLLSDLGERLGEQVIDLGDLELDPPYCLDGTSGTTNRILAAQQLPDVRRRVHEDVMSLGEGGHIVILGGECTIHPAALAGLRASVDGQPLGHLWFDAHGDFHTHETTETGSIWGFPLALSCGLGDPLLVEASGGGAVAQGDSAHLGGQAMDELEARMLASSEVSHFGTGMLGTPAGLAAFAGWLGVVAQRVRGVYVSFDMDVLDDSGGSAVALPEPNGMPLETALQVLALTSQETEVLGIGFTTLALSNGDAQLATSAVGQLAAVALTGRRP